MQLHAHTLTTRLDILSAEPEVRQRSETPQLTIQHLINGSIKSATAPVHQQERLHILHGALVQSELHSGACRVRHQEDLRRAAVGATSCQPALAQGKLRPHDVEVPATRANAVGNCEDKGLQDDLALMLFATLAAGARCRGPRPASYNARLLDEFNSFRQDVCKQCAKHLVQAIS